MSRFPNSDVIYDYIVVGAGSAGAALAARLSEDTTRAILLLEAGPNYRSQETPPEIRGPYPQLIDKSSSYFWPALKAQATTQQQPLPYLRGRGVGGSSAINAMCAIRGVPEDFDTWASLGCTGWAFDDVLPSFMRLEADLDYGDQPYHSCEGPIPIHREPMERWGPVARALSTAAVDLGYGRCDDHNAPTGTGCSPYASMIRNQIRVSTNDAYLEPARQRQNLHIAGNVLVDRVEFNGRRATGVRAQAVRGTSIFRGNEVILSAGAIHSPAILMRSGIGQVDKLRAVGITPLVDSPTVGQNLAEHPLLVMSLRLRDEKHAPVPAVRCWNCCVRYTSGLANTDRNDMFLLSMDPSPTHPDWGALMVSVYQTFSRGWLSITTADPKVDPAINFQLLSDERDLVRMREGLQRMAQLAHHPAIASITQEVYAGAGETRIGLEELTGYAQIDAWLLATCTMIHHAAGSCRMGPVHNPGSVVDPDGRVIGVAGLRVADASIMPTLVRANTHLTAVMIGEHIAERIRRSAP